MNIYPQVAAHMAIRGISRKELADAIHISYAAMGYKLTGASRFTLDEAAAVRRVLRIQGDLEDIFKPREGAKP